MQQNPLAGAGAGLDGSDASPSMPPSAANRADEAWQEEQARKQVYAQQMAYQRGMAQEWANRTGQPYRLADGTIIYPMQPRMPQPTRLARMGYGAGRQGAVVTVGGERQEMPSQPQSAFITARPMHKTTGKLSLKAANGVPGAQDDGKSSIVMFDHVSTSYRKGRGAALQNVSFGIEPGEFVFLIGASGSGKTTCLRLIMRELKPDSGRVVIGGRDISEMRSWEAPYMRRQIGCVNQSFDLLDDKTAAQNVMFALECIGEDPLEAERKVDEVLRLVGMDARASAYPSQLSGGEQQRVSIARSMANRPPLLICDEPTGNLDPAISDGIMDLLDAINRSGTTVIMATHDASIVDKRRKRVIALKHGRVISDRRDAGYDYSI